MDSGQHIEPSEFDVVVIGTGLVESIVAAAAAKVGKSVLQLDPAGHYGGAWASLRLDEFVTALREDQNASTSSLDAEGSIQDELHYSLMSSTLLGRRGSSPGGPPHAFSLDLAPHVLYGAGPMIALLLGSGAHHYTEFKLVHASYLGGADGQWQAVPSTRAEIFRDRTLSPPQKRSMMRFLKACGEALDGHGPLHERLHSSESFVELMQDQGLDEHLRRCLFHGVLLRHGGDEENSVTCREAFELLQRYVSSVGLYGVDAGPFLATMYGSGELPQAFCRAAAVAGAVQVLRCGVDGLNFDEHTFTCNAVELTSGQIVRCSRLAAGTAALSEFINTFHPPIRWTTVHRALAILDAPVLPDDQHSVLGILPSRGVNGNTVWVLQLGHGTASCPRSRWVVHLWTVGARSGNALEQDKGKTSAKDALMLVLQDLADCSNMEEWSAELESSILEPLAASKNEEQNVSRKSETSVPTAIIAAFFSVRTAQLLEANGTFWPRNVALCPGPQGEVTLAASVHAAKKAYWELFPSPEDEGSERRFPLDAFESARDGAPNGQHVDPDSDDEAVAALQAALRMETEV